MAINEIDDYGSRPLASGDLPVIRRWLATPNVVRWWGDPDEQFGLVSGDLDDPRMGQWVVSYRGVPFAYTQAYTLSDWPQKHLAHLPPRTKMIDAFIGEPAFLGRGHGQVLLRLFARTLIVQGASLVAIDPEAENMRARRAYAAAGFAGEMITETDEDAVVVMIFEVSPKFY